MKNTLRKVAAVVSAVAMSLGMLVATATPASAVTIDRLPWPTLAQYEVGDTVDLDFSCKPTSDGEVVAPSSSALQFDAPPGTTLDPDYHLRGTFTTTGTFDLGAIRCYTGSDTPANWFNFYIGSLIVVPASTPAPSLNATVLSNYKCEVRLVGVMPATPDAGTATISVTTGADTTVLTLRNYAASEIVDITLAMNNFISSAQGNANIAAVSSQIHNIECGDEVIFILGYQHAGAPVATAQSIVTTRGVAVEPTVWVSTVLDQACTVRVQAAVSQFTDDDLFRITVSAGIGGWDIRYKNVTPGNPLDTVIDFANAPSEDDPRVESVFAWGEPFDCQNAGLQAGANYNGSGVNVTIISNAVVTPICAAGSYGKVVVAENLVFRQCVEAEPGTYVETANVLGSPVQCPPGRYADEFGQQGCKPAPLGASAPGFGSTNWVPCEPGTFADVTGLATCKNAAKGYYITDRGAVSATKCAAGLTTELLGSRSINECYKQKFQTAKAIKTPTKLKFGGKFETAGRADAGLNLNAVATGSCTLTATTKTVKINGKSVKQPRWVIKATKKAGNCKVTFSNDGDYTYKPFTVTKTIKVTKTGK